MVSYSCVHLCKIKRIWLIYCGLDNPSKAIFELTKRLAKWLITFKCNYAQG